MSSPKKKKSSKVFDFRPLNKDEDKKPSHPIAKTTKNHSRERLFLLPSGDSHFVAVSSGEYKIAKEHQKYVFGQPHEETSISDTMDESQMEKIFYDSLSKEKFDKLERIVNERKFKPKICKKFRNEMKKQFIRHFAKDSNIELINIIERCFDGNLKILLNIDYFNTQYIQLKESLKNEKLMRKIRDTIINNKEIWRKIFNEVMGEDIYFRNYIYLIIRKGRINPIVKKAIKIEDKQLIKWLLTHGENRLKCTHNQEGYKDQKDSVIFKTNNYLNHYFSKRNFLSSSSKQREMNIVLHILQE